MSIPSLASNLENLSSAYFDSRQSRHLGSSEAFQSFLLNSPYTSATKITQPTPQKNGYGNRRGEEIIHNNDDVLDYLSPQKRSCIMIEANSAILAKTKRYEEEQSYSSMAYIDFCDLPATSKSVINETVGEYGEEMPGTTSHSANKLRKLKTSQTFSRGFACPNMENLDPETKQFIEGLQDRIVRLEGEVTKLKRDNQELNKQNKKHEDRMIAVVEEQEKLARTRGDYEKKISSLRENCQNNQDIADSLKQILAMQEGEFYERVVKKEKKFVHAKSMPTPKTSKSSIKLPQNKVQSVPSIEAIMDPKEEKGNNERKKLSMKIGAAKSASKNSINSLCSRKCSATNSMSQNGLNCFKTTEVPL